MDKKVNGGNTVCGWKNSWRDMEFSNRIPYKNVIRKYRQMMQLKYIYIYRFF